MSQKFVPFYQDLRMLAIIGARKGRWDIESFQFVLNEALDLYDIAERFADRIKREI